jgi:hypothetical protein
LNFPVKDKNASIGSFWGDQRDEGRRRHEGIDIFAPKGAPVIAAADGTITSVTENRLGGLVVFMNPDNKDFSLYYAHLGKQLVSAGQLVKAGDTIGTVDNTGNAKNTPSHLHFGIYTTNGAIDPFPFVQRKVEIPSEVNNRALLLLTNTLRCTQPFVINHKKFNINTILFPLAVTSSFVRCILPDHSLVEIPIDHVEIIEKAIDKMKIKDEESLKVMPKNTSPVMEQLTRSSLVSVFGYFDQYAYVKPEDNTLGWILSSELSTHEYH